MWYRLKLAAKITRQLIIFLSSILPSIPFFFFNFLFLFNFSFIFEFLNFYFYHEWPLTLRCPLITTGSPVSPTNPYKTLILYTGLLARDLLKASPPTWGPAQCLRVAPTAVGRT